MSISHIYTREMIKKTLCVLRWEWAEMKKKKKIHSLRASKLNFFCERLFFIAFDYFSLSRSLKNIEKMRKKQEKKLTSEQKN